MPAGGYQNPEPPAAVSGPGAFSQRTDGQPGTTPKQAQRYVGGGEYGTNKAFNEEVVSQAPMAAAPTAEAAGAANPMSAMQSMSAADIPDLFAPTERPNEPATAGVDFGEGPGSEVLQYKKDQALATDADRQRAMDVLRLLESVSDRGDVSHATRQMVRRLRGVL